jgi:hypothetical protein
MNSFLVAITYSKYEQLLISIDIVVSTLLASYRIQMLNLLSQHQYSIKSTYNNV